MQTDMELVEADSKTTGVPAVIVVPERDRQHAVP
jgi:hypothetical protein